MIVFSPQLHVLSAMPERQALAHPRRAQRVQPAGTRRLVARRGANSVLSDSSRGPLALVRVPVFLVLSHLDSCRRVH